MLSDVDNFPSDIASYRLHRLIGKGAFGHVYEASILSSPLSPRYAVKVVDKLSLNSPEMLKRIRNEIAIHTDLRHPNILRLYHHFDDYKAVYLVMELCEGGELYQLLKSQRHSSTYAGISEPVARQYFIDIVNGLHYLHDTKNIIHRDLKLSNILLYKDNTVERRTIAKIGDFGLACYTKNTIASITDLNMTICGTPNYLAPEVVQKRPYGREADLWSLGCLLFAMLVGRAPFEGHSLRATFDKVVTGVYTIPEQVEVSTAARDIIGKLMQTDPQKRPRLADLLSEHPFITGRKLFMMHSRLQSRLRHHTNTTSSSSNLNTIIDTRHLKPIKQSIKHGCIEIDHRGSVIFTVDSDQSVMTVSGDGQRITFTDANRRTESCRVEELGRAAKKRYEYMKRFVDLVRSKTPIVIIRHDTFKMTLFESERGAVVHMTVYNNNNPGTTLQYEEHDDTVTLQGQRLFHPTPNLIHSLSDPSQRMLLLEFVSRLSQLQRITDELDDTALPFVVDETRHLSKPNAPSYITLRSMSSQPGEWSALSALQQQPQQPQQQPQQHPLMPQFVPNLGWRIDLDPRTRLYLTNEGRQFRHDHVENRVSEDGGRTWRQLHVADPLYRVIASCPP